MTVPLLDIAGLTVSYGGAPAVDAVSLTIIDGECVALLGPNGAGKSSLLRAVLGLIASSGTVTFSGTNLNSQPVEARVRAGIGYVPEGRRVFAGLSVRDNLEAAMFAPAAERGRRLEEIYLLFPQLHARDRDAAWQLSGGQQQMLALGRALVQKPRLLLLDEPSLGLAPALAREVFAALAGVSSRGTAILMAEQNVRLAATLADRTVFIDRGTVRASRSGEELRDDLASMRLPGLAQSPDRSSP